MSTIESHGDRLFRASVCGCRWPKGKTIEQYSFYTAYLKQLFVKRHSSPNPAYVTFYIIIHS